MGCGPKIGKRKKTKKRKYSVREYREQGTGTVVVLPRIPAKCSNCGASLNEKIVKWVGPTTAKCPYCDVGIPVEFEKIT